MNTPKKVYVQIVDYSTGNYQFGLISEPIKNGLETVNAIIHFLGNSDVEFVLNSDEFKCGIIKGTTKKFTAIII